MICTDHAGGICGGVTVTIGDDDNANTADNAHNDENDDDNNDDDESGD